MNNEVSVAVGELREEFNKEIWSERKRIAAIKELQLRLNSNRDKIIDALNYDLGKPLEEAKQQEWKPVLLALTKTIKNLRYWLSSESIYDRELLEEGRVVYRPRGVVLIMVPSSYPLLLSIGPLIAALAAGNTVLLSFSHKTPTIANNIKNLFVKNSLAKRVKVVIGDNANRASLLESEYDFVFFSGTSEAGRIVRSKIASKQTEGVFQVGGKCPAVIADLGDSPKTARAILRNKAINAGQSCWSIDYLIVHEKIADKVIYNLHKEYEKPTFQNEIKDMPAIRSEFSYRRLKSFLQDAQIVFGGICDDKKRKIELSLILPNKWKHPALEEEIYGPILPMVAYRDEKELLKILGPKPKCQVLYLFSKDLQLKKLLLDKINFGSLCQNDTIVRKTYADFKDFQTFSKEIMVLKK